MLFCTLLKYRLQTASLALVFFSKPLHWRSVFRHKRCRFSYFCYFNTLLLAILHTRHTNLVHSAMSYCADHCSCAWTSVEIIWGSGWIGESCTNLNYELHCAVFTPLCLDPVGFTLLCLIFCMITTQRNICIYTLRRIKLQQVSCLFNVWSVFYVES